MDTPRFYHAAIAEGAPIELGEDTSRHVVQVLRMQAGDELQLTDGQGRLALCTVLDAHKKHTTVRVVSGTYTPRPLHQSTIAISPLKNASRFEWFLEKATELGIAGITPILCQRTEKQNLKMERLQNILVSAMLQSQQVWLPLLSGPVKLGAFLQQPMQGTGFIAHCEEDGEKPHLSLVHKHGGAQVLMIGPEGDFTPQEILLAKQAGYEPVSLGATRLRTETAGVLGAGILMLP